MQNASLMEIKQSDVAAHLSAAADLMRSARHAPTSAAPSPTPAIAGFAAGPSRPRFDSVATLAVTQNSVAATEAGLIAAIGDVAKDDPLQTEVEAKVLRTLRTAIAVARAMGDLLDRTTELGALKRRLNDGGHVPEATRALIAEHQNAAGTVAAFVACAYAAWGLADLSTEGASAIDVPEPREFRADNPPAALSAFVWELTQVVQGARDDASLVRLVREHCMRKAAAFAQRARALKHLDGFLSASYRLEASEFTIKGFEVPGRTRVEALTMSFKRPEEVVGNHLAKSASQRLAKMLMAYDPRTQTSPFVELGGFSHVAAGDGNPGTGKTTLIQMMAGIISGYCSVAGYNFRYKNFGIDEVSEFQGLSGRNCRAFVDYVQDPSCIGFGTIDDIDQVAGKRGDRQSSAGQQEVTAVLMDAFAGPNTIVRGNATFGMYSNYPENVDDALRQRAGARFLIDGPQSLEDYRDIAALLLKRHLPGIGLGEAEGKLFATQKLQEAVRAALDKHRRPQEKAIADVFDRVVSEIGPLNDLHKLAVYLKAIRDAEPRFTGRAVKNIADAVKARAMDFDMPDEWFETPEVFMHQSLDRKTAMLRELMLPVSAEMVLEQINIYADSEARYGNKSFDASVEAVVRDHAVRQAALRAIAA